MTRWFCERWSGFDWIPLKWFPTAAEADKYAQDAWDRHRQVLRVSARVANTARYS